MPDIKKLLKRNRFFLEILGIVALGEFAVMVLLDYLAPAISMLHADLLDALSLMVLVAPFIFWRSRAVHGREAQNLSDAVQHSSTAVLLLDTGGRIYWVNTGFTQMSGYSLNESVGLRPAELLGCDRTDASALASLKKSLATREPCRVVVINQRKDGSHYYGDLDFRPDYDKHGKLVGFIEICTDVTELKLAKRSLEASLRESEALRQTVDTHAIVSVADHAGRIIEANSAFCAISGYSREQLFGQDHRMLNSGTHAPEFWTAMWDDISHGKPWRGEICNRDSSGKLYWVDSMIAPFLGADGLVEKYVSMRMDITARKSAEVDLARQTQLLTEVVDAAPYGVAVYDDQQVLRFHNDQFGRKLDLPAEMLALKTFHLSDQIRYLYMRGDYGYTQSLEAVLAGFQEAIATRAHLVQERRQFNGRHIELGVSPISAGWTVLNYRDNTERKNQQLNLIDAQERVRLATESAGIGIWSVMPISGEQTWDAQQYSLFGIQYEANQTTSIYELWSQHLHPEDAEQAREAFQNTLNLGVPFNHQFRIIRPDGAVRHIKALGSPRFDADGRVDYVVGTNMDVTDAVLLAESMKEARDRAEEASLIKSQFLANMSHEIRTPMNAVLGMLTLLGRSDLSDLQRNYIERAESSSRMMIQLIDDILDHTRINASMVTLLPKAFCLDEVLQQLSDMASANLGSKEIDVLFDVDPSLPAYFFGDSQRLQQILVNLLGNAIKFTLSGEVVCRIHLQSQDGVNCRVVFCIRDSGIGIAPTFRESIFKSFTQVQSTTTREFGGIGLGLPISQQLVEMMGGSIEVESEVGIGSSFSFELDLALPEGDEAPPPSRPTQLAPEATLVVDDCPISLDVISAMAEGLNWRTSAADDGAQALEMIRSSLATGGTAFTLILLDWNLPDVDNTQIVRQIRTLYRDAHQSQPCIILLSNNSNPVYHQRMLDMGDLVNACLAKPFTSSMLRDVLARAERSAYRSAEQSNSLRPQRLKGLRVLAVDDLVINQNVIEQLLMVEGALVSLASNGRLGVDAVLAAMAEQPFDVVLMDIQMPVMDGYEATRLIRSVPQLAQLPIIAVTANVQTSDREQCFAAGMNHHIAKPCNLDELVAVIRSVTGLQSGVQPSSRAIPQPRKEPVNVADSAAHSMSAYWIRATPHQPVPVCDALLKQGVQLQVLESVEDLGLLLDANAPTGLLVVDQATATSAAMRALGSGLKGASMKAMQMIALADAATDEEMRACLRAGVVDMVPNQFALNYLNVIGKRHLNNRGERPLDEKLEITAIDSQRAMADTESDVKFFGSLLQAFFTELPVRKMQIKEDWSLNPQQVKHHIHALKGLAMTFGMHQLVDVVVRIEAHAAQSNALDASMLEQLEGEIQSAGFQILRWLQLNMAALEVSE
ncbi:MAG: PAS domain S-box protein [Rhodoferax sp.]|uniref:PAS domain S-box protein n=1 Tax=Rhodoferax sp. TaxID=50421 RepID=UPI003015B7B3